MENEILNALNERDVYLVPLEDIYPDQAVAGGRFVVYAPFADQCDVIGVEEARSLAACLRGGDDHVPSMLEMAKRLTTAVRAPRLREHAMIEDKSEIVLLLNQKCNFNCRYCYSANGRNGEELPRDKAIGVLERFMERSRAHLVQLSFGGGGDPLMSWPLMSTIIDYVTALAEKHGKTMEFVMTTNGSLFTDEIVGKLKRYNFKVQVSFEILPEVQNAQRGSHAVVAGNIDRLLDNGIVPNISSVITPISVGRQREMVEYCLERFPRISHASFDYVKDYVRELSMCENVDRLSDFLERFYVAFHEAKAFAAKSGFRLTTPFEKKIHSCKEYSCEGNFCVTPSGSVTACPRISSPRESVFRKMKLGEINSEGLFCRDDAAVSDWYSWTWNKDAECRTCPIKWNCGGGCPLERLIFPHEMQKVICDFSRRFIFRRLIEEYGLSEKIR